MDVKVYVDAVEGGVRVRTVIKQRCGLVGR